MNIKYHILFSIEVLHRYFGSNRCRGVEFLPSKSTTGWMETYRMLLRNRDGKVTLLYDEALQTELVEELKKDTVLDFYLKISDPVFTNYTNLEEADLKKTYFFSNIHSGNLLHPGAEAGAGDLRDVQLPPLQVARIEISVNRLHSDSSGFAEPAYQVQFNCRSTFWNYFVTSAPKIQITQPAITGRRGNLTAFNGPTDFTLPNGQKAWLFTSPQPLLIKQFPSEIFQLKKNYETSFPGSGEIVLDNLPNPPPESIRFDKESGAFFSDIYIHL